MKRRLAKIFWVAWAFGVMCNANAQTYKDYRILFLPSEDSLERRALSDAVTLVLPAPVVEKVLSEWDFTVGNPSEGLHSNPKKFSGEKVSLPHRILKADHPLWYAAKFTTQTTGVLWVSADDGAQIFINGKKVSALENNIFPISKTGALKIVVRVLNNAMAGGLRSVKFITNDSFSRYCKQRNEHNVARVLRQKQFLMNINPDTAGERVWSGEERDGYEAFFKDYPLLTGPYLYVNNGEYFVKVESEYGLPITLEVGSTSATLTSVETQTGPLASFSLRRFQETKIFYRIRSGKTLSPIFPLDLSELDSKFSFNVWADSQYGWEGFARNLGNIEQQNDAFGVGVGDLVATGADETQWQEFLRLLSFSASRRPYFLVAGNHDYDGYYDNLVSKNYHRYISTKNYFSWTFKNAAFIALDPNENFPVGIEKNSEQYQWLMKELSSDQWKTAGWRFIFFHQPLYSQGWDGYHGELSMRELLEPLLESAKIDFVVSGHTHDYERLTKYYGQQQTTFFIVGGGGGSLEPPESSSEPKMDVVIKKHHFGRFIINGGHLRFEARDLNSDVMDTFEQIKQ
jgi:hypothetical protein